MPEVTGQTVEDAYLTVEKMLKGAVEGSPSPEAFQANLQYCQIVAQRLLAVLIFNAATQNKSPIDPLLEQVGLGIKRELNDIVEASKQKDQLTFVSAPFQNEPQAADEQH